MLRYRDACFPRWESSTVAAFATGRRRLAGFGRKGGQGRSRAAIRGAEKRGLRPKVHSSPKGSGAKSGFRAAGLGGPDARSRERRATSFAAGARGGRPGAARRLGSAVRRVRSGPGGRGPQGPPRDPRERERPSRGAPGATPSAKARPPFYRDHSRQGGDEMVRQHEWAFPGLVLFSGKVTHRGVLTPRETAPRLSEQRRSSLVRRRGPGDIPVAGGVRGTAGTKARTPLPRGEAPARRPRNTATRPGGSPVRSAAPRARIALILRFPTLRDVCPPRLG